MKPARVDPSHPAGTSVPDDGGWFRSGVNGSRSAPQEMNNRLPPEARRESPCGVATSTATSQRSQRTKPTTFMAWWCLLPSHLTRRAPRSAPTALRACHIPNVLRTPQARRRRSSGCGRSATRGPAWKTQSDGSTPHGNGFFMNFMSQMNEIGSIRSASPGSNPRGRRTATAGVLLVLAVLDSAVALA